MLLMSFMESFSLSFSSPHMPPGMGLMGLPVDPLQHLGLRYGRVVQQIKKQSQIASRRLQEFDLSEASLRETVDNLDATVLIAGASKSGKTTLINCMLASPEQRATEILPARPTFATSAVTEVRNGKQRQFRIVLPEPAETPWSPFKEGVPAELVAVDRQKTCADDPTKLQVQIDKNELLKSGITIVDSPGLAETVVFDDLVHEYIKTAKAIIFVIPAEHGGLRESDQALLNQVKALSDRLEKAARDGCPDSESYLSLEKRALFVVNRCDPPHPALHDEVKHKHDQEEYLSTVYSSLSGTFPHLKAWNWKSSPFFCKLSALVTWRSLSQGKPPSPDYLEFCRKAAEIMERTLRSSVVEPADRLLRQIFDVVSLGFDGQLVRKMASQLHKVVPELRDASQDWLQLQQTHIAELVERVQRDSERHSAQYRVLLDSAGESLRHQLQQRLDEDFARVIARVDTADLPPAKDLQWALATPKLQLRLFDRLFLMLTSLTRIAPERGSLRIAKRIQKALTTSLQGHFTHLESNGTRLCEMLDRVPAMRTEGLAQHSCADILRIQAAVDRFNCLPPWVDEAAKPLDVDRWGPTKQGSWNGSPVYVKIVDGKNRQLSTLAVELELAHWSRRKKRLRARGAFCPSSDQLCARYLDPPDESNLTKCTLMLVYVAPILNGHLNGHPCRYRADEEFSGADGDQDWVDEMRELSMFSTTEPQLERQELLVRTPEPKDVESALRPILSSTMIQEPGLRELGRFVEECLLRVKEQRVIDMLKYTKQLKSADDPLTIDQVAAIILYTGEVASGTGIYLYLNRCLRNDQTLQSDEMQLWLPCGPLRKSLSFCR